MEFVEEHLKNEEEFNKLCAHRKDLLDQVRKCFNDLTKPEEHRLYKDEKYYCVGVEDEKIDQFVDLLTDGLKAGVLDEERVCRLISLRKELRELSGRMCNVNEKKWEIHYKVKDIVIEKVKAK